jgi:bacteriorhodopsin
VPLSAETAMYAVLDVLAKVGFGFILLRSRAVLGDDTAPTPSGEATTADD